MYIRSFETIYRNGTYVVTNCQGGTKQYIGQEFNAEFPDSLDIKITEMCNHGCPFCHESSTPSGRHGNLNQLVEKLRGLPKGVELAIGGGNALLHPNLIELLKRLKDHFRVALTVTIKDTQDKEMSDILDIITRDKLITSLGISIGDTKVKESDITELSCYGKKLNYCTKVFHVIPGVTDVSIFRELLKSSIGSHLRILILGFKSFGRSKDKEIPSEIFKEWSDIIKEFYDNCSKGPYFDPFNKIIAFDNLAIEQLNIKSFFPKDFWEEHYMGNEFTHSMYVDTIKGEYAPTSRSPYSERTSWDVGTVMTYFKENHD